MAGKYSKIRLFSGSFMFLAPYFQPYQSFNFEASSDKSTTCTVILPWKYRRKQWNKNCIFLKSTLQNYVIFCLVSSSVFSSAKSCKIGGRWLCSVENAPMVPKRQRNFKTSSGPAEMLVQRDILVLQQHLRCCEMGLLFVWVWGNAAEDVTGIVG